MTYDADVTGVDAATITGHEARLERSGVPKDPKEVIAEAARRFGIGRQDTIAGLASRFGMDEEDVWEIWDEYESQDR